MSVTHIVGVDPGLVHTGVVRMVFDPQHHEIIVEHEAVIGPNANSVVAWARESKIKPYWQAPTCFIEGYRPRSNFNTDKRMTQAVSNMHQALPGSKVLDNTGVKKVVRRQLMQLLGVWTFGTPTHHDDLRSAARIALLGMLKDEQTNQLLADVVRDHLAGDTWVVK